MSCATRLNVSVEIPIFKVDLENPNKILDYMKSQFSPQSGHDAAKRLNIDRIKRIKVHYKTTINRYIELDNITQYEKIFEPTFDLENCLSFIPKNWESIEEILNHYLKFYEDIFADYIMIEF